MKAHPVRLAMALAAVLTLGACESKPPMQTLPPISFANEAPIQLDVGQLEIVSEYQPPGHAPNYEHLMPVSPAAAATQWAKDRLKPMGRSGYARVVIKDASVVRTPLKTDKSLTGLFKEEQAERYDGSLDVTIQILDDRHMPLGDVDARATRSRTVPENATVNERDRVLYEITEAMIRDVDTQMNSLIPNYLGRWILH